MTKPRVGQTLISTVDTTTVVVVRAPADDLEITCGGAVMTEPGELEAATTGTPDPEQMGGSQLGKRYAEEGFGVEVLCTKAGEGSLAVNGVPLSLKGPKPLPASD
ncbi:hypothetical protein ACFYQA_24085 [Streptomyces sp. NPDC005774]|uniref:hypothetical protein n=1 Tax=Streptomyces sp. NPDC005774 TaxID=3364728 RepID=UPI00369414E4